MRLDKYLKVSRLINNNPAKPSKEVKVGDLIKIQYGRKIIEVKVTSLLDSTKKADASLMYELVSETQINE